MTHNMKNILAILIFTITLTSCSTDDSGNSGNSNSGSIEDSEDITQTGTWRVTNFIDSGDNETSDFNGYNFTFASSGTLTASNGTTTYNGTWSITDSSSSSDDLDFNIFFNVPSDNDFEDLNDDWDIVSITDNKIDLIDVSGGNGGTDLLTFEAN